MCNRNGTDSAVHHRCVTKINQRTKRGSRQNAMSPLEEQVPPCERRRRTVQSAFASVTEKV